MVETTSSTMILTMKAQILFANFHICMMLGSNLGYLKTLKTPLSKEEESEANHSPGEAPPKKQQLPVVGCEPNICLLVVGFRHLEDEPLGHAFFSPESVKALTGAELSATERKGWWGWGSRCRCTVQVHLWMDLAGVIF